MAGLTDCKTRREQAGRRSGEFALPTSIQRLVINLNRCLRMVRVVVSV